MSIFSTWAGKTNKVGRKHSGRALRGALKGIFFGGPFSKNVKRSEAIGFCLSKKFKR